MIDAAPGAQAQTFRRSEHLVTLRVTIDRHGNANRRVTTRCGTNEHDAGLRSHVARSGVDEALGSLGLARLVEVVERLPDELRAALAAAHLPPGTAVRRAFAMWQRSHRNVDTGGSTRSEVVERCHVTVRLAVGPHGGTGPTEGKGTAVAAGPAAGEVTTLVTEAVSSAQAQVDHRRAARRTPTPGPTVIVFGPGAIGTVLHEACGHSLEGDALAEGSSFLRGAHGRRVGSELCTLLDDPTRPGCWGSFAFDDEGCEAQPVTLLDAGVVNGALHSSRSAAAVGAAAHSSARAESYRVAPQPRMSNTFLAAGPHRPEDVLPATDEGLYCGRVGAGSVEPSTGEFMFSAEGLWSVRVVRRVEPLQDGVIFGRSPHALAAIDMVADDVVLGPGRCGKDNPYVPVAQGGPTTRVVRLGVRPA